MKTKIRRRISSSL